MRNIIGIIACIIYDIIYLFAFFRIKKRELKHIIQLLIMIICSIVVIYCLIPSSN